MNIQEIAASLWGDFSPQAQPNYCAYAAKFQEWASALCTSIGEAAQRDNASAVVAVNRAKILLVDKYFEWRAAAPKSHRNRAGEGHTCLFHVFDETYRTLRAIELTLTPPLLFLPAAATPAPPAVYSIAGIALTEKEDEE